MGLNKGFYPAMTVGPGLQTFEGYFYPNGSGTISDGYTPGVTVARTGTGIVTLTLPGAVQEIVYVNAEIYASTAVDNFMKVTTMVASTGVITIKHWDISSAAVAELPAANADTKIMYSITVRNSLATA